MPRVYRACASVLRCRLHRARRVVLGDSALAAQPAASRRGAVDRLAARVGVARVALVGPLAQVDLYADWAFDGDAHGIFGRMTYGGEPVHGFHTTASGAPTDSYGRSLYIDTRDSAVRAGLEAGDVGGVPQADRLVLLLVLAHP